MKKHYEKMCVTPLGVVFEGNLLGASTVNTTRVRATGQEVENLDFSDSGTFNHSWEEE